MQCLGTSEKMCKLFYDIHVQQALSVEATNTVVHAFVFFVVRRQDDCNFMLFDVSDSLLWRLPIAQNAAERHVTERITPVCRQLLHWLPVRQRIEFKLAVLVYKALNGIRSI